MARKSRPPLTLEEVRRVLRYDFDSGHFYWRVDAAKNVKAGALAGCYINKGYRVINIGGSNRPQGRLVWFYVFGEWPIHHIDHINNDPSDNRIGNLRDVTPQINSQNKKKAPKNSMSGVLGVSASNGRFIARIFANGKRIYLGVFGTAEEASKAYLEAKRSLHKGCVSEF